MHVASLLLAASCLLPEAAAQVPPKRTAQVDPFIGTKDMGHCYPGATVPFGFVQLSPDTDTGEYSLDGKTYRKDAYRYCAGYQHGDPTLVGFSHTHFHGTGHSDLGDLLVMPTVGPLKLHPGTVEQPGYRSRYTGEKAGPGYYAVSLTDPGVKAELTATTRVGVHRYTFPKSDAARIVLDLVHGIYTYDGKVIWSRAEVKGPNLVTGMRQTRGWARDRQIFFAMAFSKPFKSYGCQDGEKPVYRGFWRKFELTKNFPEMVGRDLRLHFDFDTNANEPVMVKVALSSVSVEGALKNLESEMPHWDFDRVRQAADARWEKELAAFDVQGTGREKRLFYTQLYHSLLSPVEFQDVDGRYRGLDREVHEAKGFTNHTVFSLWDTFRALHPLFTLIQPTRTNDLVNSMLAHFEQSPWKLLPVWSHHGNENWCMTGYHSLPVIADAWMKGIRGFDGNKALNAMVASASAPWFEGVGDYQRLGWVPDEKQGSSASKTLEYAYDDWTVARMAESLGRKEVAEAFGKRALNHRKLWDSATGFMRARRSDGSFRMPFDPLQTHDQGYIEGNAWNYSLFAPHDAAWLTKVHGGGEAFGKHLDQLFTMELDATHIAETEDLNKVGLMGNYAHGNEPSHHVPYLYVWAGQPWKTQARVRQILSQMYQDGPSGLCGNDDAGQMSAWYIFSACGFYPVTPGSNEYVIGAPFLKSIDLNLPGGKTLAIRAPKVDDQNPYIQRVLRNGKPYERAFLTHEDILGGGTLTFEMGPKPSRWGTRPEARPFSFPAN